METIIKFTGLGNTIWLILFLNIIFNAIADGIRDKDLKTAKIIQGIKYHFLWALSLLFLSLLTLIKIDLTQYLYLILVWITLRFAIFDYIRNFYAKKKIFYIGNTSLSDRILQILNTPIGVGILMSLKALFFIISLAIVQNLI